MFVAEFDLTAEYADEAAVRANLDISRDGWAYVIETAADVATVHVMSGSAFYAGVANMTLVRTYDECVLELGKLVGL